ncbi:MAG: hypothetical protein JW809_07665 [Pirellulales bacterium]|nr:hypothetical protein [Pirellulales bacterium]
MRLFCPRCGAPLRARVTQIGRSLPCPRCHEPVPISPSSAGIAPPAPETDEYALRDMTHGVRELPPEQHSGPVVPVTINPSEAAPPAVDEAPAEHGPRKDVRPHSERPKLPPWPMFTRVLTFYRQPDTLVRWIILAVAGTIVAGLGSLALAWLSIQMFWLEAAVNWIRGLICLLVTVFVGAFWLLGLAGASLAILRDSAAGNDRIENWPESTWIDWVVDALYVYISLIIAGTLGYAVGWIAGLSPPAIRACAGVSVYLLFPIVMLSTLEAQSPLAPCSPVVLACMRRSWGSWLIFYIQTSLLGGLVIAVGAMFGIVAGAIKSGTLLVQFVLLAACTMSLLLIGAQFLYFRLLGRVAWISAEHSREAEKAEEAAEAETADAENLGPNEPEVYSTPVDDF